MVASSSHWLRRPLVSETFVLGLLTLDRDTMLAGRPVGQGRATDSQGPARGTHTFLCTLVSTHYMASRFNDQSTLVTAFGLLVAIVAVVGTQFLGWEWGSGQLVPTLVGVVVAGIAVVLVARRVL